MINSDDDPSGSYASPPCFAHELEGGAPVDAQTRSDIMRWRKAERERQIAARLAIPADVRAAMAVKIGEGLDRVIGDVSGHMISLYWPFRGEPDLRPWMETVIQRGGYTALPLVVEKGAPLIFRAWKKGDPLEKGVWNIPVPADGPAVMPSIVISPLVGFDAQNFRLGYGGGFFDRTLAAMTTKPLVIGIGYSASALPTIYPLPHDIAMDAIVTEAG
ncbi:5-formyltetrahydrofolate cyclo-ligase [Mesorhizobium sp. NBSH29]|uniref:5-formyltetrahydrofolate cyclo-ligase n=1 Tax=Mesorhizobium sp. NBSH29 TaxID=2654249 RepID=UPI0018963F42|nr:5-formyltetrahydrofolate cyclo-ligase [Mesorhizobium sp. NBSH29]QPC88398.1 5-formyltetrahydrofolate cyclo-ligase [Mesorhizobium sp. NBSH29]